MKHNITIVDLRETWNVIMLATSKSNSICPFTLKSIAQIKHEDLAVIYETTNLLLTTDQSSDDAGEVECGHSCMLANLVSYLHDNGGGAKLCPVCQLSPASVICDFPSSDFLTRTHGSDGYGCRIISFRYGTITYFLWVQSPPRSSSSSYEKIFRGRNVNAFDRICSVLGIDVKSGLKVRDLNLTEDYFVAIDWFLWSDYSGDPQRKGYPPSYGKECIKEQ